MPMFTEVGIQFGGNVSGVGARCGHERRRKKEEGRIDVQEIVLVEEQEWIDEGGAMSGEGEERRCRIVG